MVTENTGCNCKMKG